MTLFVVAALALLFGFVGGFGFAIVCYPDKQEIIDRIKRERGAS